MPQVKRQYAQVVTQAPKRYQTANLAPASGYPLTRTRRVAPPKIETGFVDTAATVYPADTTGGVALIATIPQGTSVNQRVGKKIKLKSLQIRGFMASNATAIRNDVALAEWCNAASAQDAWHPAMTGKLLFEAAAIGKFDNLTAGKRDAWRMMLDFQPLDFARNKLRKAVVDVWGLADSIAVLQACVRKASNGEEYLGGTEATENTVSAWRLNFSGQISMNDVSNALNGY